MEPACAGNVVACLGDELGNLVCVATCHAVVVCKLCSELSVVVGAGVSVACLDFN